MWRVGVWSPRTRGNGIVLPKQEVGSEAAVTHGSTWACVMPFVLACSLYTGVPGPQGTDSGPLALLRRGCEFVGGANISFPT
jgi:hypothetical protein